MAGLTGTCHDIIVSPDINIVSRQSRELIKLARNIFTFNFLNVSVTYFIFNIILFLYLFLLD